MEISLVTLFLVSEVEESKFIYLPPSASDIGEFDESDKRELVDPRR